MRLHQARAEGLGGKVWRRSQRPETWDKALWRELPRELAVRLVRFKVECPGFRTETVVLVTTLLDTEAYPDAALAELYRRRWQVEGCFRDLKTTLGLDVLRTQSPELIEREILQHALAYNLVRALMLEAACVHSVPLQRISFKGALTTLRQWAPILANGSRQLARQRYAELLLALAADLLPVRPNRSEPRAVKRRPKSYQLMTLPRPRMMVSASRSHKK